MREPINDTEFSIALKRAVQERRRHDDYPEYPGYTGPERRGSHERVFEREWIQQFLNKR